MRAICYAGHMGALVAYTTVVPDGTGESLVEDRKSQFFGFAAHAETAKEAVAFRHSIIARIPEAGHYVSAWVFTDGTEFFSDAKEPRGTAGMPVLSAIKGRGLADTVCVVARIFGGTLLGKGGLMRAYTKAACDAIDAAVVARRVPCRLMQITMPYALYEPMKTRLPSWGAQVEDEQFAEVVTLSVSTPVERAEKLTALVRDYSNARAACACGVQALRYLSGNDED